MGFNKTILICVIIAEVVLIIFVAMLFIRMFLKLKEKPTITNQVDIELEKELRNNS